MDISRTVSRIGLGAETGIDRVERAYIDHVLEREQTPLFLARIAKGVAILDRSGMERLLANSFDTEDDPVDLVGRLTRRVPLARRRAETMIRSCAVDWAFAPRLPSLVERSLPAHGVYFNIGHANLERQLFDVLGARGYTRCVMVHDMIPLDTPEYARADTVARFEEKMRVTSGSADIVICNSEHTASRVAHWFGRWGRVPQLHSVPLGIPDLVPVDRADQSDPPEFLVLGTIEPRKNHSLLLDIWDQFHKTLPANLTPRLHIVGRHGWGTENVRQTLDTAPFMGVTVFEHGYIDDARVRELLSTCRAVLFPSFAEGFGLPLAEALQMGVPVIASDLPCFHEISEDGVTYLPAADREGWIRTIMDFAEAPRRAVNTQKFPGWDRHFERLWKALGR